MYGAMKYLERTYLVISLRKKYLNLFWWIFSDHISCFKIFFPTFSIKHTCLHIWSIYNAMLHVHVSSKCPLQEARVQRSQQRWDGVHSRLQQEEAENQALGERVRNAKINRIEHFQKLEEEGQQRKDVRIKVTDQHLALYRSQVLPWSKGVCLKIEQNLGHGYFIWKLILN